ncbi:MAG: hypothetical protein DMD46_10995 [Gemmatimonadetes bacterium]|nr:MAG: hypothetical protein DMD46_10995 [Gemmatimonadota bacterium]
MRIFEPRAHRPCAIGHRRRGIEQHGPHGGAAVLRLAAGLERHVEWCDDSAQLRGVPRRHEPVPARPGDGATVGGQDRDTSLHPRGARARAHTFTQVCERRLAGEQRRLHAALREPPSFGDGGGKRTLQLRRILGESARPNLGPAALDPLHLQRPGQQRHPEQ